MISRVADYCFWFGRYVDRAESSARLLQATRIVGVRRRHPGHAVLAAAGDRRPAKRTHSSSATAEAALGNGELVQEYMTWSRENPVSLASSVRAAREGARAIRESLSLDAWEEINELYLWLGRESTRALYPDNREEFYRTCAAAPSSRSASCAARCCTTSRSASCGWA